jgi:hypothetical protein
MHTSRFIAYSAGMRARDGYIDIAKTMRQGLEVFITAFKRAAERVPNARTSPFVRT